MSKPDGTTPPVSPSMSVPVSESSSDSSDVRPSTPQKKQKKVKTKARRKRSPLSNTSSSSSDDEQETSRRQKKRRAIRGNVHFFGTSNYGEEKMIPVFDPQKADQSIEIWVRRVDELVKCYKWDDLTIIRLVTNRLVGMARRWYDSQEQLAVKWKKMKKLLVKQFTKPLPFSKLLRDAATYETQSNQNFSEYCFNKLDKLRALKIKIPEVYLVDAVIGGITDENIARSVRSSRFNNTNELYAYLSSLGNMPKSFKSDGGRKASRDEEESQEQKATTSGTQQKQVKCFNCRGPHRARECPN